MAGGTLCSTEKGFTVRVPELRSSTTLAVTRCEKRGKAVLCLDNAFSLIDVRYRLVRMDLAEAANPLSRLRLKCNPADSTVLMGSPQQIKNAWFNKVKAKIT